ncbi:MAG: LacI family DNA-binding transcriptional regulator [Actinocatenispora sp.]
MARPSLRDVASAAGVSITLASFAINGRAGVSDSARQRILDAARQLGYHANPHARALRTGSSNTFALMIRNVTNPFFLDVVSGAQEAAFAEDASVLVVDSDYSSERELRHLQRLAGERVEGLAIAPVGPGASVRRWQELCPDVPTVVLNATAPGIEGVRRVGPDNTAAVELAVRHLAGLGHREIAFLTAESTQMADHDRLAAFLALADTLGIRPRPVETALTLDGVSAVTTRLLTGPEPPSALITNSDHTAHAVYKAARALGVRIGADLSVVGHDDLPTSELLDPPLTTLRLNRRELGRAVFARMLDPTGLADHREPVELVVRDSTRPVARS